MNGRCIQVAFEIFNRNAPTNARAGAEVDLEPGL